MLDVRYICYFFCFQLLFCTLLVCNVEFSPSQLLSASGADIDFVENEGLEGSDEEGGLAQNAYDMPPSESDSEEEDELKDL